MRRVSRIDLTAPVSMPPVGQLRTSDRLRIAVEVLANYVPMWRAVRTNDLSHMASAARAASRPLHTPADEEAETAARLGGIVQGVMRVLPTDKRCLITSLVTLRVLSNRSIDGRLVIGVQTGDSFTAHAWVEHDDRPILPAGGYIRLHEL